jgi:hypothetical protein
MNYGHSLLAETNWGSHIGVSWMKIVISEFTVRTWMMKLGRWLLGKLFSLWYGYCVIQNFQNKMNSAVGDNEELVYCMTMQDYARE